MPSQSCFGKGLRFTGLQSIGETTEVLATVEEDKPKNHFNDAKCDCSGRLWFGTMGNTTGPLDVDFGGGFYGYSKGQCRFMILQYSDLSPCCCRQGD